MPVTRCLRGGAQRPRTAPPPPAGARQAPTRHTRQRAARAQSWTARGQIPIGKTRGRRPPLSRPGFPISSGARPPPSPCLPARRGPASPRSGAFEAGGGVQGTGQARQPARAWTLNIGKSAAPLCSAVPAAPPRSSTRPDGLAGHLGDRTRAGAALAPGAPHLERARAVYGTPSEQPGPARATGVPWPGRRPQAGYRWRNGAGKPRAQWARPLKRPWARENRNRQTAPGAHRAIG